MNRASSISASGGGGGRLEATPGFEPGIRALQAPALPLGHVAWDADSMAHADRGQESVEGRLTQPSAAKDLKKKPGRRPGDFQVVWSGRRDLNPRRQPWQGCTLPLSYSRSAPCVGSVNLAIGAGRVNLSWVQPLSFIPATIHLRARMRATGEIMAMRP